MAYDDIWGIASGPAFDFSTQTVVSTDTGDLAWGLDIRGNAYVAFRQCYVTRVQSTLEDLEVAPEKLDGPFGGYGLDTNDVYVIKASDGLYVKFRILGYTLNNVYWLTIDYYVQTDGTPNFGPSVAVEPSTWGRVKALYR